MRMKEDWRKDAFEKDSKPEPVSVIPEELHSLGRVFFPIPSGRKGWSYRHSLKENRYYSTDEVLNGYLEQGWNYGIACDNDLAVLDIDNGAYADGPEDELIERLPDTMYQITGSGGHHLFYKIDGLSQRQILTDNFFGEKGGLHIGEVKCDPHGYVVGPGSSHPSGGDYGPLKGDSIAEVDRLEFLKCIDWYASNKEDEFEEDEVGSINPTLGSVTGKEYEYDFYDISADDVLPFLDAGERVPHPVHGSTTGMNFMKNKDGETFTCWRCSYGSGDGCGLSGLQFLAQEYVKENKGITLDCDAIRRAWGNDSRLDYYAFRRAVKKGLYHENDAIPVRVIYGMADEDDIIKRGETLNRDTVLELKEALRYDLHMDKVFGQ